MVKKKTVIKNNAGIHVRPSGIIIKEAAKHSCDVCVRAKGMDTDLTDYLGLIALGLCKGDTVEIEVNGLMTYDRATIKMNPTHVTPLNKGLQKK